MSKVKFSDLQCLMFIDLVRSGMFVDESLEPLVR